MISRVNRRPSRIERDCGQGYRLRCHSAQVPVLKWLWKEHDFPPFEVRNDAVTLNGDIDYEVTILFGKGDHTDRYQQVLDGVEGDGLEED